MKAFYALLLFVGYVCADFHECDPLAADTYKKDGADPKKGDQHIPLDAFLDIPRARYFVSQATESSLTNANSYCNATSHGKNCGAIEFFREITEGPERNSEVGADKLRFDTIFVGVNDTENEAVEYHVQMKGINEDDYIIQADVDTEIKAIRIRANGKREEIKERDIPADIIKALRKPYGLFYSKSGSFTAYCTCDGTTIWVSYTMEAIASGKHLEKDEALDKVLDNLKARAREIRKKANKENEEPVIRGIPTEINNEKFNKMIPVP